MIVYVPLIVGLKNPLIKIPTKSVSVGKLANRISVKSLTTPVVEGVVVKKGDVLSGNHV